MHALGIDKSLIISKYLLEHLRSKKPGLLSSVGVTRVVGYRFVRIDPFLNSSRRLLRYIVAGNINSVVVKQHKKINRRRIIKFEQVSYNTRRLSKLTQEQRNRFVECSRMLSRLEESYEDNAY